MAPLILQIFVSEKMDLLAAKLVAMLILGLGSLATGSSIIMISFHHLPSIVIIIHTSSYMAMRDKSSQVGVSIHEESNCRTPRAKDMPKTFWQFIKIESNNSHHSTLVQFLGQFLK